MNSSVHVDNKGKDIIILGEGSTQGLSIHDNGSSSFLFVNAAKVYQFKGKNSEIKDYALCLGNVSKDFTINNIKKTGLKGVAKLLSVDLYPIDTNDILDIHKYLMKRT